MTAGALPGGLTLDGSTGIISGTPSATGDFNATIKVSNTSGDDSRALFFESIVVRKPLLSGPISRSKKYGDANMTLSASVMFRAEPSTLVAPMKPWRKLSGDLFQVASVTDGLVTHVRFDNTTGTSATNEVGPDGTLYNMTNADWVAGKFGNALDFDGSDDYVELPESVGRCFKHYGFRMAQTISIGMGYHCL